MILLGSKSPRRKMLTEKKITKHFLTYSPDIDESLSYKLASPIDAVRDIAKRKCLECISKFSDYTIITADTIVVLDNEIIHKPIDNDDAKKILRHLSNKKHQVITAYAIKNKDDLIINHVVSHVYFNELSDEIIEAYVLSGSPLDKAGAYGIQDNDKFNIISHYDGSYDNIMGFPVDEILIDLEKLKK